MYDDHLSYIITYRFQYKGMMGDVMAVLTALTTLHSPILSLVARGLASVSRYVDSITHPL